MSCTHTKKNALHASCVLAPLFIQSGIRLLRGFRTCIVLHMYMHMQLHPPRLRWSSLIRLSFALVMVAPRAVLVFWTTSTKTLLITPGRVKNATKCQMTHNNGHLCLCLCHDDISAHVAAWCTHAFCCSCVSIAPVVLKTFDNGLSFEDDIRPQKRLRKKRQQRRRRVYCVTFKLCYAEGYNKNRCCSLVLHP